MSKRLPEHLDPWRFADLGEAFAGSVALQDLSRLRESLLDDQGRASFELEFYRDERRRACLKGRVEATLLLECQRCLKAVLLKVSSDTAIAFVEGFDEAEQLPEALDPWMVEDQRVSLQDLIEDELLLGLAPSGDASWLMSALQLTQALGLIRRLRQQTRQSARIRLPSSAD